MKKPLFLITMSLSALCFAQNKSGIHMDFIDKSVDPKQDFYSYACGTWLKSNTIPETESAWGSFNEIKERNDKYLKTILTEVSADKTAKPGSNTQKIRDYYNMAMDTVKLEKDGLKHVKPYLDEVDKVKSMDEFLTLMAKFHKEGIDNTFGFAVFEDMKNSNENAAYLGQSGTFLPDKDFYFEDRYAPIREAYQQHQVNMFEKFKLYPESAKKYADVVYGIEKQLASKSMNRLEQRDIEKQYNKFKKEEVYKMYPNLKLDMYFKNLGITNLPADLIVGQLDFMANLNDMIKTVPLSDWKTYMKFCVMHEAAPYLNKEIVDENFSFYGTVLSGVKVQKPRWKTSLTSTDHSMGEALGQLYVEKYFSEEAKKRVNVMVDNLMAAYRDRINSRAWMSDSTKKNALHKLEMVTRKLAYPDKWKDYSKLDIKADAFILNHFRVNKFGYDEMLSHIGKPVDKTRWGMSPPTINAYYNPSANEIVFPAGIMQPPFFDQDADEAFNYGIMGAVIGHELTHGFDDQGAQFDADGNFNNWWSTQDLLNFESRTGVLVKQFNNCLAVDSVYVNGELTLGENIADLGGLTMAFYAYKKFLDGKKSDVKDGFTGEQRFFIAWAQGWKNLMRPQALKQLVATNPHSPGNFRANMPLTNMPEFYETWGVKEGDKMYRKQEDRAEIW